MCGRNEVPSAGAPLVNHLLVLVLQKVALLLLPGENDGADLAHRASLLFGGVRRVPLGQPDLALAADEQDKVDHAARGAAERGATGGRVSAAPSDRGARGGRGLTARRGLLQRGSPLLRHSEVPGGACQRTLTRCLGSSPYIQPLRTVRGCTRVARAAAGSMSSSAHVIRVKKLYRQGLKCLHNWTVHRDLYISKGFELRAEFDAQKLVTNPSVVEKLVSDGEAKLVTYAHPSPYTRALAPAHRTQAPRPLRESPRAPLPRLVLPQFRPCPAAPSTSDTQTTIWDGARRRATPDCLSAPLPTPFLVRAQRPRRSPPGPPLPVPSCDTLTTALNPRLPPRAASCAPSRATSSELAASVACICAAAGGAA